MRYLWCAILAVCLAAAACGPSGDRTPLGGFDVYRESGRLPDSRSRMSLYYRRHLLTNRYGAAALDPRNPGRILFSGDTESNSDADPCGTFLFDAATARQERIAAWPDGLGPWTWAPDGRRILLVGGGTAPEVLDLDTRDSVVLASALSLNGQQLDLHALGWSPDSQRIAAVVELPVQEGGRERDWDLIEITLDPLSAAYVATMRGVAANWAPPEYRWQDGRLISVGQGRQLPIFRKADSDIGWTPTPPEVVKRAPPFPCTQ
jgi:hypothetical protein